MSNKLLIFDSSEHAKGITHQNFGGGVFSGIVTDHVYSQKCISIFSRGIVLGMMCCNLLDMRSEGLILHGIH